MPILSHVRPNTEVSFCIYPFVVMGAIAPQISVISLLVWGKVKGQRGKGKFKPFPFPLSPLTKKYW